MDSKDKEYNPDENTNTALKKGWGGGCGQKPFSSKQGAANFRGNMVCWKGHWNKNQN